MLKWDISPERRDVRIAYGSVSERPIRLVQGEGIFKRKGTVDELVDRAIETALGTIEPMNDLYGTAEYRAHLVEVLTRKLFLRLFKEVRL